MHEPTTDQRDDAFPSTDITWLGAALADGERGAVEAARHIMRVYARPLTVYYLGSTFARAGEPAEMVDGFFASRLANPAYLHQWITSGRPLRRWLIVGFRHYLHENVRSGRRARRVPASSAGEGPATAQAAFDREAALAIVREAMRVAQERCERSAQREHWELFVRHHLHAATYDTISNGSAIGPRRAAVMARTAAGKFKHALRELVAWPGATDAQIDEEIRTLLREIDL